LKKVEIVEKMRRPPTIRRSRLRRSMEMVLSGLHKGSALTAFFTKMRPSPTITVPRIARTPEITQRHVVLIIMTS
jgi:hypothetical protein